MEWMSVLTSLLALVFVLSLIAVISLLLRKYGHDRVLTYKETRQKRLSISDVLVIDGKRKLILIKRDEREHLILCSTEENIVIEQGILPPDNTGIDGKES